MPRSKMYYSIFETDTHYEYHVSNDRSDIVHRRSMSRRIVKDASNAAALIIDWLREAEIYDCVNVPVAHQVKS